MKIALLFGPFSSSGRPLNFFANNIWISERGLSGSDLGVVVTAQQLAKRGHDVSLFTYHVPGTKPPIWEGVKLYNYEERLSIIDQSFNVLISWNEPDVFRDLPRTNIRICQQMLNDFNYCAPGFDDLVDIWTSPSEMHMSWMQKQLPSNKWVSLPLGSEPAWFTTFGSESSWFVNKRVKGRIIWTSSPDRGLHLLLQQWSKIKSAVPEAHLKIFYHINDVPSSFAELYKRVNYCKYAIEKLKDFGVEYVGSVSRHQIAEEYSQAEIMVAPLDTISPTEGFSVSTIEACTAGCFPVVGNIDCLGSIYGNVACMIPSPVANNLDYLSNCIIKALIDDNYRQSTINKCQKFAKNYTWTKNIDKLEQLFGYKPAKSHINSNINNSLIKLNIGAGPNVFPFDNWINYDHVDFSSYYNLLKSRDINTEPMPYVKDIIKYLQNGGEINFKVHDLKTGFPQHSNDSVDLIAWSQCIEHLNPIYEVPLILKECFRILKPGGLIRIVTPDLDLLINAYKNNEMDKFAQEQPEFYKDLDPSAQLAHIMYGSAGINSTHTNYEGHMFLYTQKSMTQLLENTGFKQITFYYETGKSLHPIMQKEAVDQGMTHSFIVEAIK